MTHNNTLGEFQSCRVRSEIMQSHTITTVAVENALFFRGYLDFFQEIGRHLEFCKKLKKKFARFTFVIFRVYLSKTL